MSTITAEHDNDVIDASFEVIKSPIASPAADKSMLQKYNVTESQIANLQKRCDGLTVTDSASLKQVVALIAESRDWRVQISKTQDELKANAVAYRKRVDAVGKFIIDRLHEIEKPLKEAKIAFETAKEKAKAEAEAAKQALLKERLDILLELGAMLHPMIVESMTAEEFEAARVEAVEAFTARKMAERKAREEAEAKQAEQAEQLRIEAERIAAERAELLALRAEQEAQRAKEVAEEVAKQAAIEAEREAKRKEAAALQAKIDEANRIEREKIEAQKAALQADRDRLEREEFQRQEEIRLERERAEQAERDRLEAIAAEARRAEVLRLAEIEKQEAEAKAEALKPDIEKFKGFAAYLRGIIIPVGMTIEGERMEQVCRDEIQLLAIRCERFAAQ